LPLPHFWLSFMTKIRTLKNKFSTVKQFEVWQSKGDSIATTVCEVGLRGDQCRSILAPDAKLIWKFEGYSHLDTMQRYYDFMGFGIYISEWPDLDCQPYFLLDALKSLRSLPQSIKPLREIKIFADGHTVPAIPSPMPMISIQEKMVFSIGVWVVGDYGGHQENPINHAELLRDATALLQRLKPHLFRRKNKVSLICPVDIAEKMRWPADGKPRVIGDAEP
jgi:hypothetical protein